MIEIVKGREPGELMFYRKQKFASYKNMPRETHEVVIQSLMREQGYICAYCMCRIPQKGKNPPVTIEHINAQSVSDDSEALDYRNMLAVCNGNRGCGKLAHMSCDARRGNETITVNPLKAETLSSIEYKRDGTIFSANSAIDDDLANTLNLNCAELGLAENRRSALQTMQREISKKHPGRDIKSLCAKYFDEFSKADTKEPYVGILLWWLKKKADQ